MNTFISIWYEQTGSDFCTDDESFLRATFEEFMRHREEGAELLFKPCSLHKKEEM